MKACALEYAASGLSGRIIMYDGSGQIGWKMVRDLIVVLGPPRSYTSLVSTMLGQHPQLYGFPETHLLGGATVGDWFRLYGRGPLSHGLLRLIAEVVFGAQTAANVVRARLWLQRRRLLPTPSVLLELMDAVAPRTAVEKSPLIAADPSALQRMFAALPDAFYIHLTRHPLGQGQSLLALMRDVQDAIGPLAGAALLRRPHSVFADMFAVNGEADPQRQWLQIHDTILSFLSTIPAEQTIRVRGEDLLADPDGLLAAIAERIGIRRDPAALNAMKHPEQSPFASIGPLGAQFGADPNFLRSPAFRPGRQSAAGDLRRPLPWRSDGASFCPAVRALARSFGYS